MSRLLNWHNALLAVLAIAIGLDFLIGIDPLLNAVSAIFATLLALFLLLILVGALAGLAWLTVQEGLDDIRYDGMSDRPWRYRLVVIVGIAGMVVDGVVGSWTAFQHGIRFSAAVGEIPFSGVPVYIIIASFPFRWVEDAILRRRHGNRRPQPPETSANEPSMPAP